MEKEISLDELKDIINNLPKQKAPGRSRIPYELLSILGSNMLKWLLKFFNLFLKTAIIPESWKNNILFPLSKKPSWDGRLANIRPITLIETTRKVFFKILTARTLSVISKGGILQTWNTSSQT